MTDSVPFNWVGAGMITGLAGHNLIIEMYSYTLITLSNYKFQVKMRQCLNNLTTSRYKLSEIRDTASVFLKLRQ
jgi:hypothetical protein